MIDFILNNKSFFIFILFLTIFLFWKRKKVEIQGSFPFLYMIMYKTSLGLVKMDKWSKNHPKVFLYLSHLSIFIGMIGIFLSFAIMIWGLDYTITNDLGSGGGLVLPIQTENGLNGALPVFYVPFWYWIIALFVLVVVHEFAHGVIAERHNIKVKSSGFAFGSLFLPIMPAAFVEPDEKSLKKANWKHQIAVFGAGSTSNFLFGFLFLAMWLFIAAPLIDNTMQIGDITFNGVMNQSDLKNYNITSGTILSFNGNSDNEYILNNILNLSINQTINFSILDQNNNTNNYMITTFKHTQKEDKGMLGITGLDLHLENKAEYSWLGNSPFYFERLLFYFWMLNIGIGIMNLLPLWITDGGQITRVLLSRQFRKKTAITIYNWISLISLLLVVFTIKPDWLIYIINLIH